MRKLTGFDVLLRKLSGLFNERALRLQFLASGVRVSERQFPQINDMVRDGAYVLDLPEIPEVFVTQNPLVNAMALGSDKPFIVINTGLIELLDAEELRTVVGHELGHVLSGHAVYRTMLFHLINLAARIAWVPLGYIGLRGIIWALEEWYRKSELSCDRAGLLASQDPDAARRVLMKLAGGARLSELNSDAFMEQAHDYDAVPDVRDGLLKILQLQGNTAPVRGGAVRRADPLDRQRRVRADPGRRLPAPRHRLHRHHRRGDPERGQVLPGILEPDRGPPGRDVPRGRGLGHAGERRAAGTVRRAPRQQRRRQLTLRGSEASGPLPFGERLRGLFGSPGEAFGWTAARGRECGGLSCRAERVGWLGWRGGGGQAGGGRGWGWSAVNA